MLLLDKGTQGFKLLSGAETSPKQGFLSNERNYQQQSVLKLTAWEIFFPSSEQPSGFFIQYSWHPFGPWLLSQLHSAPNASTAVASFSYLRSLSLLFYGAKAHHVGNTWQMISSKQGGAGLQSGLNLNHISRPSRSVLNARQASHSPGSSPANVFHVHQRTFSWKCWGWNLGLSAFNSAH